MQSSPLGPAWLASLRNGRPSRSRPRASTLKVDFLICINGAQSLARREFQLGPRATSAALDHLCGRPSLAGSCLGRHLHQPGGILQSAGSGCGRGHRVGCASHATAFAPGYRPTGPSSFVAQCSGITMRYRSGFLRSLAPHAACLSERRPRGCHLFWHQRHRRAPRPPQTSLRLSNAASAAQLFAIFEEWEARTSTFELREDGPFKPAFGLGG